jgi:hypothetical protein
LEAGIGHRFDQADIGRRLKTMGDTRPQRTQDGDNPHTQKSDQK